MQYPSTDMNCLIQYNYRLNLRLNGHASFEFQTRNYMEFKTYMTIKSLVFTVLSLFEFELPFNFSTIQSLE